jgi:hypothetical protein
VSCLFARTGGMRTGGPPRALVQGPIDRYGWEQKTGFI